MSRSGELPLVLVGFMGSGKSTVGAALAGDQGWRFLDIDAAIVEKQGRSIDEIFQAGGESAFRDAEWLTLRSCQGQPALVVAAGGGLTARHRARVWLRRHARTVWIDVPLPLVRARVGTGAGRPLWRPDDPVLFRAFFERRRALYALCDHRVNGEGDATEVSRRILALL